MKLKIICALILSVFQIGVIDGFRFDGGDGSTGKLKHRNANDAEKRSKRASWNGYVFPVEVNLADVVNRLQQLTKRMDEQQKQVEDQQKQIDSQQKQINNQTREIERQKKKIDEQQTKIKNQKGEMAKKEEQIGQLMRDGNQTKDALNDWIRKSEAQLNEQSRDLLVPGNELFSNVEYRANSTWSDTWNAWSAMKGRGGLWCSGKGDKAPVWRISFGQQQRAKIRSIEFEEKYAGAIFEFFASNSPDCSPDKALIEGDRETINGVIFENRQLFSCYGLQFTKLAHTKSYGPLATIKNLQFFVDRGSLIQKLEARLNQVSQLSRGFLEPGNELYSDVQYNASSTWGDSHLALKAMKGSSGYWCSASKPKIPLIWRMLFGQQNPARILSIEFEEVYAGAKFEFFASNSPDCSPEKVLINGNREKINGVVFENGQQYSCYGLKIMQIATRRYYGTNIVLATIKNFQFFIEKGQ